MYVVKQLFKDVFEVTNFEDGHRYPTAVYRVQGKKCSCPARNPCKHQSIISTFKGLEFGAWGFEFVGKEIQPFNIAMLELQ